MPTLGDLYTIEAGSNNQEFVSGQVFDGFNAVKDRSVTIGLAQWRTPTLKVTVGAGHKDEDDDSEGEENKSIEIRVAKHWERKLAQFLGLVREDPEIDDLEKYIDSMEQAANALTRQLSKVKKVLHTMRMDRKKAKKETSLAIASKKKRRARPY